MPGIVIITYNSASVIESCLDACLKLQNVEIVVVDNASQDQTVSLIMARPAVRLVANTQNVGFGAAVNQGIGALRTDSVLLLNPDAVPVCGIESLAQAVLEPGIGAAGGQLLNCDGSAQRGFNVRAFPSPAALTFEALGINRLWPGNPVNRRYRVEPSDVSIGDVDQPAGAFLMVRRSAFASIGGFDEGFYPIWFEDVDFCKRLKTSGFRILIVPQARAIHQGAHSAGRMSWKDREQCWYGSLLRYASKHYSVAACRVVSLAVILACIPRTLAAVLSRGTLEPVSVYSRVVLLASRYLLRGGSRASKTVRETPSERGAGAVRM